MTQAVQEPFQEWLCEAAAAFPWMEPVPAELGAPCAATAAFGAVQSSKSQRWHAGINEQLSIISLPSSPQLAEPSVYPTWMG